MIDIKNNMGNKALKIMVINTGLTKTEKQFSTF